MLFEFVNEFVKTQFPDTGVIRALRFTYLNNVLTLTVHTRNAEGRLEGYRWRSSDLKTFDFVEPVGITYASE